jgi:hypothetical protein
MGGESRDYDNLKGLWFANVQCTLENFFEKIIDWSIDQILCFLFLPEKFCTKFTQITSVVMNQSLCYIDDQAVASKHFFTTVCEVGQQWDKQIKPIVSYTDVWNLLLEPMT